MRYTVGFVIFLCFLAAVIEIDCSNVKKTTKVAKVAKKKSKISDFLNSLEEEVLEGKDDKEDSEFEFATTPADLIKAWNLADGIPGRNRKFWRKDKKDNIMLSIDFTRSSPLAFKALIKQGPNGEQTVEAVQEEYYGSKSKNNHMKALKYIPKDTEQDDLLSLIEIALMGNVADETTKSYCWCPSLIHQDLFKRDDAARRWHMSLYDNDPKYGMAGHNLAFQHMGVALKNIKNIPERTLDTMDQMHTTMYIHNYQPECADVVSPINFPVDAAKMAENVKNNWGLPRVADFIEPGSVTPMIPATVRPIKLNKLTSSAVPSTTSTSSTTTGANLSLSELEWPSLSSVDPNTTAKKKKKTNSKNSKVI